MLLPIDVKLQAGGWADPGKFDMSQILHPWAPRKCQIPTLGYRFMPKTGLSYVKFPTQVLNPNVKIPTKGKARRVTFPWVAHSPPPWDLTLMDAL